MSVRVRFAPSPTGYLHIGGARTALYSYLFARGHGGKYILRIEDTDLERSKREFEEVQIEDLNWLGITHDEGPDVGGDFGPYRQSERTQMYIDIAWQLVKEGKAYPCFLTSTELEELAAKAESEKIAPHTYHTKYRDLDPTEAKKKIDAGEEYVIRFKNPGKTWTFKDLVRGEVTFPVDMVGDWVIIRSNGMPVYNYCCVIDDWKMEMTHVMRAEEHLNNTCRQLMLYEALGAKVPEFAHVSLLVGEDRQKLSKRHGATSVKQYRDENYLPDAINNYLCLLGWSHPEEKDIFDVRALGETFSMNRFSKSPALYDIQKLNFFNSHYLRALTGTDLVAHIEKSIQASSPFHKQTAQWKTTCCELIKEKIQLASEANTFMPLFFEKTPSEADDQLKEALAWETTPAIREYLKSELSKTTGEYLSVDTVNAWMDHIKKELKIKGKPLFMGTRAVLTGQCHGPDLQILVSLTPIELLKQRV